MDQFCTIHLKRKENCLVLQKLANVVLSTHLTDQNIFFISRNVLATLKHGDVLFFSNFQSVHNGDTYGCTI